MGGDKLEEISIVLKNNGDPVAIFPLSPKQFKTGSVGYNGFGKAQINGKRYQVNINVVEIGSKPK
jgi:hypothetical protein